MYIIASHTVLNCVCVTLKDRKRSLGGKNDHLSWH